MIILASGSAVLAEPLKDAVTLSLTSVAAVEQNGSPAPDRNGDCRSKYEADLGMKVRMDYDINKETGIMIAHAEVNGISTVLHPMGLAGTYSFMSGGLPDELKAQGFMREIFALKAESAPSFDLMGALDKDANCVLSSLPLEGR